MNALNEDLDAYSAERDSKIMNSEASDVVSNTPRTPLAWSSAVSASGKDKRTKKGSARRGKEKKRFKKALEGDHGGLPYSDSDNDAPLIANNSTTSPSVHSSDEDEARPHSHHDVGPRHPHPCFRGHG